MSNFRFVFSNPLHLLAFGFGSGLSPRAPGTVGTLAAVPFWLLLVHVFSQQQLVLLVTLGFIAGVWICGVTSRTLGVHDHGGIVWPGRGGQFRWRDRIDAADACDRHALWR